MRKIISLEAAVAKIPSGASIMVGGFLGVGTPPGLVAELLRQGRTGLTVISNDIPAGLAGIGKLVAARAVKHLTASYIGANAEVQRQMIAGETEVELVPQGTLAERIRAGGFGLGAVVTPTGVGTRAADGKRTIDIDGRTFLVELPLKADFALIHARRADHRGNLEYAFTSRNFNPLMAMAGRITIAEVDEIVPMGVIPPDMVMTPHPVVDFLVLRETVHG